MSLHVKLTTMKGNLLTVLKKIGIKVNFSSKRSSKRDRTKVQLGSTALVMN